MLVLLPCLAASQVSAAPQRPLLGPLEPPACEGSRYINGFLAVLNFPSFFFLTNCAKASASKMLNSEEDSCQEPLNNVNSM